MELDRLVRRLERTWAVDAAAFARVLGEQDPSWHSEALPIAGGQLVLCGPGLYVNRAIGVGIDPPLTHADIDTIGGHSGAVGVPAAVEVTPATHSDTIRRLTERGYAHDGADDVTALVRTLDQPIPAVPQGVVIKSVSRATIADWEAVTALGWGHTTEAARRSSDAFARAALEIDGDGMVIASDRDDGRPLGCASLTVRDGVATLGGMSTIPVERGRGVQRALILHRLRVARDRDCDVAATTTKVGSQSERNVIRLGFRPLYAKRTLTHCG